MRFTLPELPFAYDALEPHIDARTMEIHHTKHHQAYVDKLNQAVEHYDLGEPTAEDLVCAIHSLPDGIRTAVRNFGGGHVNHSMFWNMMSPEGGGEPQGELREALERELGGFQEFITRFKEAAVTQFGSGWAWLSVNPDKQLIVEQTPNQDSPLIHGHRPVLGLDVWEHAYYLKYQNRRAEYVDAFLHLIDWDQITQRYSEAIRLPVTVRG